MVGAKYQAQVHAVERYLEESRLATEWMERSRSKGPSGFGYGSTAEEVTEGLSLAGQTILVTGCNSGLGLEAMRVLALRGARVVGTARTQEKRRARP